MFLVLDRRVWEKFTSPPILPGTYSQCKEYEKTWKEGYDSEMKGMNKTAPPFCSEEAPKEFFMKYDCTEYCNQIKNEAAAPQNDENYSDRLKISAPIQIIIELISIEVIGKYAKSSL